MKRYFIYIILVLTMASACIPELQEVNIDYFIEIQGVSDDSVRVDDTIEVFIDWINSPVNEELTLSIDGIFAKTLGIKSDSVLVTIIPSGWEEGVLELSHPNGAQCTWSKLNKDNHPQIKTVSSLKGIADDVLTISGKEFAASEKTTITINNHLCEIVEIQDTLIKVKVPESCGNGLLKMHYWVSNPENCTADKIFELGLFDYDIDEQPQRKVKAYSADNNHYLLERDASGKVTKRIHIDENGLQTDRYDDFIYNAKGLLESITSFEGSLRYKYRTYSRNQDGSLLRVSEYDDNNELQERHEYLYDHDQIVDYSYYLQQDEIYSIQKKNEYIYTDEKIIIKETFYNMDGTIKQFEQYDNVEFDAYNDELPNLGIPGYERLSTYPFTQIGEIKLKTFYNQRGELIKIERQKSCKDISIKARYEYE